MMPKNLSLVDDFEKAQLRKQPPDYFRQLRIFEALYREAMQLGALPLKDPLEGIEIDIKIAKVINSVSTNPFKDSPGTE